MLGHEASLGIQLDGVDVRALVQASGVLPQQHFFFYGPGFVHGGQCRVETGKGQTQTVSRELEAIYCLKYHRTL